MFTPNGRYVIASGWVNDLEQDQVHILDAGTGKSVQIFHAQFDPAVLAISPDSKTLATGGEDRDTNGTIELWDIGGIR